MEEIILKGNGIYLKRLTQEFATERYVSWLNDAEIGKYLESRHAHHTLESVREFINATLNESHYAFAIIDEATNQHIGNIKIGNVDRRYKHADVGFLIGEKSFWGKGVATEAIRLATDFGFNKLQLHRLWGGVYAPNIGSMRAFEKNGYKREGIERDHCQNVDGSYVDVMVYGKLCTD